MICYHHNDLDGRCAAAVVAYYFNNYDLNNYIESDYSGLKTELCPRNEDVYIVDYSFTEKTLPELLDVCDKAESVVWIDHHDSSIDLLNDHRELRDIPNLNVYVSKEQSGCYLTYQYFYDAFPSGVPLFIQLISDYDNWNHKNPGCVEFVKGMGIEDIYPTSDLYKSLLSDWDEYLEVVAEGDVNPLPQFENITIEDVNNEDFLLDVYVIWQQGYVITKYQEQQNQILLNNMSFESYLDNIKCLCINARGNSLVFDHRILDYPICVLFYFDGEYYNYSVYSVKDDISCKEIAEAHGGGGHKGAAGFRSKELKV